MQDTPLVLHEGTFFNCISWSQIRSYCGQLTPMFFTKEMGRRNLCIGSEGSKNGYDPIFKPWQKDWVAPLNARIDSGALPETFSDFVAHVRCSKTDKTTWVRFLSQPACHGQVGGLIQVGSIIPSEDLVVTLGMAIPILQKLVRQGHIVAEEAMYLVQVMIEAGITEMVTEDYYARNRWSRVARFAWETYHTEVVINCFC